MGVGLEVTDVGSEQPSVPTIKPASKMPNKIRVCEDLSINMVNSLSPRNKQSLYGCFVNVIFVRVPAILGGTNLMVVALMKLISCSDCWLWMSHKTVILSDDSS